MSFNIRCVQVADLEQITAIYAEQVKLGTASFETEAPTKDIMLERMQGLQQRNCPYFVLEEGNEILGYAYAGPYRLRAAYNWALEDSIYLHEKARGKGYGKILLNTLIEDATTKGFRQMVAVIGDSANLGSVAVHRACGFEMVGTLKSMGWKHGRWIDSVYMQRVLGVGDREPAN